MRDVALPSIDPTGAISGGFDGDGISESDAGGSRSSCPRSSGGWDGDVSADTKASIKRECQDIDASLCQIELNPFSDCRRVAAHFLFVLGIRAGDRRRGLRCAWRLRRPRAPSQPWRGRSRWSRKGADDDRRDPWA